MHSMTELQGARLSSARWRLMLAATRYAAGPGSDYKSQDELFKAAKALADIAREINQDMYADVPDVIELCPQPKEQ